MALVGVRNGARSFNTSSLPEKSLSYPPPTYACSNALFRLKRVYLLLNAKHGLNEADRLMLSDLSERCMSSGGTRWTLQAVITKIDELPLSEVKSTLHDMQKDIFEAAPACLPPVVTAAAKHPRLGIDIMRASIVDACGIGRIKL